MSTKIEKVRYAIEHNPKLIKVLLKDTSINKGMIKRVLHDTLPCRIGIEFELSGHFYEGFAKKYNIKKVFNNTIAGFYNLYSIKEDNLNNKSINSSSYRLVGYTPEDSSDNYISRIGDAPIYEIRASLKDYHQLVGLYRFMNDMNEFCKLHEGGGIHIHIDLSEFPFWEERKKKIEVVNYITNRLDEIENAFPKYKGKYNERKVGFRTKGTWVNLSRLKTIEFRTLPLTFDYATIIQWIKFISKFRNSVISNCNLRKNLPEITSCRNKNNEVPDSEELCDCIDESAIAQQSIVSSINNRDNIILLNQGPSNDSTNSYSSDNRCCIVYGNNSVSVDPVNILL